MAFKCPKCKRHNLLYVQESTEYYDIDAIYSDGSVDLGGLVDSYPHDDYHICCENCGKRFSKKEIKKLVK